MCNGVFIHVGQTNKQINKEKGGRDWFETVQFLSNLKSHLNLNLNFMLAADFDWQHVPGLGQEGKGLTNCSSSGKPGGRDRPW